ncbi:DUF5610 domain-containing protein [Massilia sp. W12]|uniref:DUF5610 domain-containing protein n=1 Tax=Massilia sp. W12 TaxID=3126507 RepID=UPI0030D5364F
MSIAISGNAGANQAASLPAAASAAENAGEIKAGGTAREQAQISLNAQVVQSSLQVAIKSGNQPLALLYKSAIQGINEALQSDLGENAIQNAMGQDNSPEATAERIVKLSTGFFEAYKQQHPGEDEGKLLKDFMQTIRGGFEQGFNEASDILQGLNVLQGDIASGIQKTYELVQKGYADFEAAQGQPKQGEQGA